MTDSHYHHIVIVHSFLPEGSELFVIKLYYNLRMGTEEAAQIY